MDKTIPLLLGKILFASEKKTSGSGMRQQWRKAMEQAFLETNPSGQTQTAPRGLERDLKQYTTPTDDQVQRNHQPESVLAGFDLETQPSLVLNANNTVMIQAQMQTCSDKSAIKQEVLPLLGLKLDKPFLEKLSNNDPIRTPFENRLDRTFYERFPLARNAVLLKHTDGWHLVIRDADLTNVDLKSITLSLPGFFDRRALKIAKITINGKSMMLPESDAGSTEHHTDKQRYLIDKSY